MGAETEWFSGDREDAPARSTILPLIFWVLLLAGVLAAALHSGKVFGAPVFRAMGTNQQMASLRLLNAPCENERVLAAIGEKVKPELHSLFKASVLTWGGRDWASCWLVYDGIVYSIDEEGALFQPVPRSRFVDDSI